MSLGRVNKSGIQLTTSGTKTKSLSTVSGLPSSPFNLSASVVGNNQINLSWTAPTQNGDTSITGYVVLQTPSGGSISYSGTSASATGLTRNTEYSFTVSATNTLGTGSTSDTATGTTSNFNDATGGTITSVSNYNGTGQKWRVHTFTNTGTLSVSNVTSTFNTMQVGGGGSGGTFRDSDPNAWFRWGSGGGGGSHTASNAVSLTVQNYPVTVGGGGGGVNGWWVTGNGGGSTNFNGTTSPGGAAGIGTDQLYGAGGNGTAYTISGTSKNYGRGGKPGSNWTDYPNNAEYFAGQGGGSDGGFSNWTRPGAGGSVSVSYRIE